MPRPRRHPQSTIMSETRPTRQKGGSLAQGHAFQKVLDGVTSIQEVARVMRGEAWRRCAAAPGRGPGSRRPRPGTGSQPAAGVPVILNIVALLLVLGVTFRFHVRALQRHPEPDGMVTALAVSFGFTSRSTTAHRTGYNVYEPIAFVLLFAVTLVILRSSAIPSSVNVRAPMYDWIGGAVCGLWPGRSPSACWSSASDAPGARVLMFSRYERDR
jgi:hypothetical protein